MQIFDVMSSQNSVRTKEILRSEKEAQRRIFRSKDEENYLSVALIICRLG